MAGRPRPPGRGRLTVRRALRWSAGALIASVLLAVLGIILIGAGSLPRVDGAYRLAGLGGPITIERDGNGVPHIQAGSEADAYRALGFVHAQDRLWQMEFQRRVGQGRLSEVVGAAGLPVDRYVRMLGLYRAALASVDALDAHARSLLDAYVQGINDWIERRDRLLPPEFWIFWHRPEPWRPADSAVWIKMMALTLDSDMRGELDRLQLSSRLTPEQLDDLWPSAPRSRPAAWNIAPDILRRMVALLPEPPGIGTGSNAFAVAASRSASGGALVAGDPHLQLQTPGVWYLADLTAPGLRITGATMPGLPFVVIGRTPDLAWSLTTTGADVQDLFVETVDPADADRYLAPTGSLPFEVRNETIRIAGQPAQTLRVRRTRHGPVVSDLLGEAIAPGKVTSLAWTALQPGDTTIQAGFALAHARDLDGLRRALAEYRNPVQNFIAGDATGRVGLFVAGAVPIRRSGGGRMPADGASGAFDWMGDLPPDRLPMLVDPAAGTVANSNEPVVGPGDAARIGFASMSRWRRDRIDELLDPLAHATPDDLVGIQRDVRSGFARDLLPILLGADGLTGDLLRLRDSMRGWDGTMAADSWQAGLFLAFAEHLSRLVRDDELGSLAGEVTGLRGAFLVHVLRDRPLWCDDRRTRAVESCAQMAGRALASAHTALVAAFGPRQGDWTLRRVQEAVLPHATLGKVPLLDRLFGLTAVKAGDPFSVDVAAATTDAALVRRTVTHAASLRIVADLAERNHIRIVTAGGQSGHPWSRWFADGLRRWARDERVDLPASVRPHSLILTPLDPDPPD